MKPSNLSPPIPRKIAGTLPILFIAPTSGNTCSSELTAVRDALRREEGFTTQWIHSLEETIYLNSQQHFSAYLISLEPLREESLLRSFLSRVRRFNPEVPIFLYGRQGDYARLSKQTGQNASSFLHYGEDTTSFTVYCISRAVRHYIHVSLPPFFRNLIQYTYNGSYSWHCPGHSGGAAFLKSPVGEIFHQFFGENLLRADLCNAVEPLGQWLGHTGAIGASERNAAQIFRADQLYFVTNGTSASNQIVCNAHLSRGDLVIVDRNCHQSVLYAIIQTGAVPVFLRPAYNRYGIAGPIRESDFRPDAIRSAIKEHPLASRAETPEPKALILTQSTYDGILYNADAIKQRLDGYIPVLHFDEAWLAHAHFHSFYDGMYAMSSQRPKRSTVYSTQSTHKLLAGLSQASQILLQQSEQTPIDLAPLTNSFLMHASTSPQYSILASLDVSSAMMAGPRGPWMIEEVLTEALAFRAALKDRGRRLGPGEWWFEAWGPAEIPPDQSLRQADWLLGPESDWADFELGGGSGFHMLDPIKTTLLTPGAGRNGEPAETGIPGIILSRYLRENGITVEKSGLYSVFIMFTVGITKGKWRELLSVLERFKADHDQNQPLWRVMPQFSREHPQYETLGLRDFSRRIHTGYRDHQIPQLTRQIYTTVPVPVLSPQDANCHLVRGQYERVHCGQTGGRISASMISVYPPGIPLLFPGERISPQVAQYLQRVEKYQSEFPGFSIHVHGVEFRQNPTGPELFVNVIL